MDNANAPKATKLLLIDDEVEFSSTLAERLNLRGFDASVAPDGAAGLKRLAEESFSMVLLDMMLPGMHGLDVLRQIRTLYGDLPVVLLTGRSSAKDGIDGMKQGATAYLTKPLDLQELLALITTHSQGGSHA